MKETKSELWLSLVTLVGFFVLFAMDKISNQELMTIVCVLVPGYAISRGLAKLGTK